MNRTSAAFRKAPADHLDGADGRYNNGCRRVALFMLGTAVSMALGVATTVAAERVSHVHVGDRFLKTIIEHGINGSETFRAMIARLDASPIQVFVGCDATMPERLSGRLNFVSSVNGVRYVQVAVRCSLSFKRQLSFLAHELQHAVEIADNAEIADADSMESYYADVGFETHSGGVHRSFETDAALEIQRRVDHEMDEKPARADEARPGERAPAP